MEKHTIIKLKNEGYSNRDIEKMICINRKTVAKYWNEFRKQMDLLDNPNSDVKGIQEKIATPPVYDSSKRTRRRDTSEID